MTPLPPSSDAEFWGDADILVTDKPETKAVSNHYLVWQNGYAVCTSCPYPHTVPIDVTKYDLKDGSIVTKV